MYSTEALAWLDSPELLKGTVERVRQVRALGMDVGVDFHGRVHKGMARQLAKLLEGEGVLFIEGEQSSPTYAPFAHVLN